LSPTSGVADAVARAQRVTRCLRTVGDVVTYLQQLAASNPEAAEAIRAQFDNRAE
jgi:hypothetical protein